MKRVTALAMAAVMLLSFTACARNNENNNASPDNLPDASTNLPATTVPTPGTQQPGNTAGAEEGKTSPEAIWNAIYDKYGDTFPVTEAIPAESLKEVTGIDPEKLESFVFQYPLMNVSASEFLIAECKEGELEAVKEEVMAHQAALVEQWEKYLPEQLKLVENYVMETAGNYVFFAVAKNAEGAADIFKGFFD
ncbi:MAG: DUF4358 domain-containing protein [Clostridiales bacterium]|nr:DUF4358 domain-containing protein [Clostridiales bacterium]